MGYTHIYIWEYQTCTYTPVPHCHGGSEDRPIALCHSILDYNCSQPHLTILLDYMELHVMYCYMEADTCEGVMRVAYMNMRNTSVNYPAPLTLYKLIWERVCWSTNTTVLSGDSVTSPTIVCVEGCWVHFRLTYIHTYHYIRT